MPSSHITLSGGLLTHQFIEAIQQTAFNHPALSPATFALPGQKTLSPAELERSIGAAWELLVERWDSIEHDIAAMDISTLRDRWIRPLFMLLDFFLEYQRADLVLEGELRFPISHFGLPTGAEQVRVPVHTVLPGRGGNAASSLETRRDTGAGLRRLAPHDLLQRYLNLNREAKWGILTDGLRLRLLRDYHHTYTRGYVEFDLQGIFSGRDFAAFRALYRLCHASRFLEMREEKGQERGRGKGKGEIDGEKSRTAELEETVEAEETLPERLTPLESFYQTALSTGVKVGEDLRGRVRDAIETFANGFIQATPGLLPRLQNGEIQVKDFYNEILHTIYRILFLLFAEQRGKFPGRGSLYMDEYSLTALRALAERPFGEDPNLDLWERLKATFGMVEHGAPGLNIFGYNGALFSASKTPILTPSPEGGGDREEAPSLHNDSLLKAIRSLTTVERDNVLQRISYADLSVEEIGSVYESLLDYTPRVAEVEETVEKRMVKPGEFFLDPRGKARKTSGSYYTHPSLVNELIKSALLPVLEERLKTAVPDYDPEHPEKLSKEEKREAEEALLKMKVIDPAAGSGAFLIAADNTLGLRLAQIRSGDLYPQEGEIRRARRDVLANCLYAVDLNPMAVELCKVSLWINAVVEDQRLNFLDHHIKCGNSLVGAFRRLAAQGIPSEAYGGATGDDKELARALKKRNDKERAGQVSAFRVTELKSLADLSAWSELARLAQEDPAEAERRYRELQARSEESAEYLAFDLWTAAFFWPLEAESDGRTIRERASSGIESRRGERRQPLPPTTQDVFQALATPRLVDERMKAFARKLRDQHRFFHWELEFPEIFGPGGPGGFDVVLGNPPWERIKLQEKEFFAVHAPEVAAAPNAAARRRMIEALPAANPGAWALYRAALREAECTGKFLRASGRYPLTSSGDINTYSVFAELDRDLIAPGGRGGIIVPSGIATDFTNKDFFAGLVETGRLASLFDFENRKKLFPEVDSRMKFSLLTLSGNNSPSPAVRERGPGGEGAEFAFFLLSTDDLNDPEKRFTLTAADFTLLNPNTRTCPIFRSRTDAELTRKLYRAAPVLVNEATGENPWGMSFSAMFHMTNDSGLFRTKEQLAQAGFALKGNRFEKGKDVWLPLYEAKMFWHFDHRFGSYASNLDRTSTSLPSTSKNEYVDPSYQVFPWYFVCSSDFRNRWNSTKKWAVVYRDITNGTNERTAVCCIIPASPLSNKAPVFVFNNPHATASAFMVSVFSSLPFDYITRQKIGGTSLNYFIVKQLPLLPLTSSTGINCFVIPKVVELTCTAWDMQAFIDDIWQEADPDLKTSILRLWDENARATGGGHTDAVRPEWAGPPDPDGFPRPPFKWDEERRLHLRAELDGLYAHLYGLTRDEFAYILDTFPIVRRKDEAKYGEFRTKRLCLEAYDRLVGSDLIPAEARELQKESVIGEKAVVPVVKPAAAGVKPVTGDRRPVTGERKTGDTALDPQSSARNQAEEKLTAKSQEPTPDNQQLSFTDYSLYRCAACGKRVLGYDRENHVREAHKGKEVGWKKVGK